ncbi:MAG: copper homeostasis protein CutC [Sphingobacteriaceae bacterium]|nr:copper homeostasis protein CutC [Sphingobacteriaceae bacterium]MBK7310596.1 copper homeostasis protein CutC [Sphingobacteriaceae bacterium]MBK7817683.1 copper homeostasis protein CutC [Sphingobacteriaceae bacterium]
MLLEIACFNIESCLIAQKAGAHRIEFCNDYESGGLAPSFQEIAKARQLIKIPLHVIIRFKKDEVKLMEEAIWFCKKFKIDGVVFGVLKENSIDILSCVKLVELARPMKCTFHRYIDKCLNMNESIEHLIDIGFDNVLTSGGKETALEGMETIAKLQQSYGDKINIIPGGGIRPDNIKQIKQITRCTSFHSAALDTISKNADENTIKELLHVINS